MALGDMFRRLMGAGETTEDGGGEGEAVAYKDYTIHPAPRREGGQWLTAGVIRKAGDGNGGIQEHRFVRAETHATRDGAEEFAVLKGKQIIDQQGDRLFQQASAPPAPDESGDGGGGQD